jgi:hypothetical protein
VGVGKLENGGGGVLDREAQRVRQPIADAGAHPGDIDGALDRSQTRRVESSEHQVGVGDGGLGAAAAVADRPRRRAGRLRAHLEHAGRVERRDGAAPRADRADIHHRHVDRQAVGDGELGGHLRDAAVDQRHVGRGAAHVVGDGVAQAGLGQGGGCGDHTGGRPRHHRLGRIAGHQARGNGAAVAVHDQQVAAEAAVLQLALQPAHVAVEDRLHRGVDRGRGAALVFAVFREQLVAEGHVVVGPKGARDFPGAQLVRRVGIGMQEVDDEALAALGQQCAGSRRNAGLVERAHHVAARVHALIDLDAAVAGDERLKGADHAVGLGTGAAAELQGVAEAGRGDQPDAGDLALQDGVGGGGGAVDQQVETGRRNTRLGDRRQHAVGLIGQCGQDLADPHLRPVGAVLMHHHVGEGAAHVDAADAPRASRCGDRVRLSGSQWRHLLA